MRQCPDRYTIRAGRNLPDKEFRYLRTVILHLSIWQRPVFLLNSRLSLFTAAPSLERPFSLSYGTNLPSSLTTLLPLALEFSSYLPVSVCGTGTLDIHKTFLAPVHAYFPTLISVPYARVNQRPGYALSGCPLA